MAALPFSTLWPGTLQKTIPSYLYVEYNDDQALQAFIAAYNIYSQQYLDWFNITPLPIYTNGQINGALLDWVAQGLYGISRPYGPLAADILAGAYNTFELNQIPYNGMEYVEGANFGLFGDGVYRRVITWRFYKGDGFVFTIEWLKRRIMRFLIGLDIGTGPAIDNTYPVSVSFAGAFAVNIQIHVGGAITVARASQLQYGILSGILELPFQFTYNVRI